MTASLQNAFITGAFLADWAFLGWPSETSGQFSAGTGSEDETNNPSIHTDFSQEVIFR